jgi:translation initiation factor 2-alpha kinase 4
LQDLYKVTEEVWRLFREILEGLVHMHGLHNIVHRDLKPENIFISRGTDGVAHVKIGDFGLATSGQTSSSEKGTAGTSEMSNVGTAMYLAPELAEHSKDEDKPAPKIEDSRKLDVSYSCTDTPQFRPYPD